MKKQILTVIAISGLIFTLAGTATANTHQPRSKKAAVQKQVRLSKQALIKQRQVKQEQRIQQGIKSGELTRREIRRLQKQQLKIAKEKRHALRDKVITDREYRRITILQDKANRAIYAKKHNRSKQAYMSRR